MVKKKFNIKPIEFFPLQKIEVTESTKAYKPGSIGYVCYMDNDLSLVKPLTVSFMRYGIKGKKRVTITKVYYNCIDYTGLDEKVIKILNQPDYCYHAITASLTPAIQETKNIDNIPDNEFVCYLAAFSSYLDALTSYGFMRLRSWQGGKLDINHILRMINDIGNAEPSDLWKIIASAYQIGKAGESDLFKEIVNFYGDKARRNQCMELMYKALSSRRRAVEKYHQRMTDLKCQIENLVADIMYYEQENEKKGAGRPRARLKLKRARN